MLCKVTGQAGSQDELFFHCRRCGERERIYKIATGQKFWSSGCAHGIRTGWAASSFHLDGRSSYMTSSSPSLLCQNLETLMLCPKGLPSHPGC